MSIDYHQTVLADAPYAYWPLEDGSGTTGVDLAGAHPLSVTGNINGAPIVPSEPHGHSVLADGVAGSDASLSNGRRGLTGVHDRSIGLWVAPKGLRKAAQHR